MSSDQQDTNANEISSSRNLIDTRNRYQEQIEVHLEAAQSANDDNNKNQDIAESTTSTESLDLVHLSRDSEGSEKGDCIERNVIKLSDLKRRLEDNDNSQIERYIVGQDSVNEDFYSMRNFSQDASDKPLRKNEDISAHLVQLQEKSAGELEEKGVELEETKEILVNLEKQFKEAREQWKVDELRLNSEIHKQMNKLDTLDRASRESSSLDLDSISSRFGTELIKLQHSSRSDMENLPQTTTIDSDQSSTNEENFQIKPLSSCCSDEGEPFMKIDTRYDNRLISKENYDDNMLNIVKKLENNLLDKSIECENLKGIISNHNSQIDHFQKTSFNEIQRLKQQILAKEEEFEELCSLLESSRENNFLIQADFKNLKKTNDELKIELEKEKLKKTGQSNELSTAGHIGVTQNQNERVIPPNELNITLSSEKVEGDITQEMEAKCESCNDNYKSFEESLDGFTNLRAEISQFKNLLERSEDLTNFTIGSSLNTNIKEEIPQSQNIISIKDSKFTQLHITLRKELEELRNSYSEIQKIIVEKTTPTPVEEVKNFQQQNSNNEVNELSLLKQRLEEQNNLLMNEISLLANEKQHLESTLQTKDEDLSKLEDHLEKLVGTLDRKNADVEQLVLNVSKLQDSMGKRVEDLKCSVGVKDEEICGVMEQFDDYFCQTQEKTAFLENELEQKKRDVDEALNKRLDEEKLNLHEKNMLKEKELEEMLNKYYALQADLLQKNKIIESLESKITNTIHIPQNLITTGTTTTSGNIQALHEDLNIGKEIVKPLISNYQLVKELKDVDEKERILFLEKKIELLQSKISEIEESEIKCFEQSLMLKTLAKQLDMDSFKYQKELEQLSAGTSDNKNSEHFKMKALEKQIMFLIDNLQHKDNNCKELTNEITRLLEERDSLQLKLSSALKHNVKLNEGNDSFKHGYDQEELRNKLAELEHLNVALNMDLQRERESRRIVQEQLLLSQSSRSSIKSKINDKTQPGEFPHTPIKNIQQSSRTTPIVEII